MVQHVALLNACTSPSICDQSITIFEADTGVVPDLAVFQSASVLLHSLPRENRASRRQIGWLVSLQRKETQLHTLGISSQAYWKKNVVTEVHDLNNLLPYSRSDLEPAAASQSHQTQPSWEHLEQALEDAQTEFVPSFSQLMTLMIISQGGRSARPKS